MRSVQLNTGLAPDRTQRKTCSASGPSPPPRSVFAAHRKAWTVIHLCPKQLMEGFQVQPSDGCFCSISSLSQMNPQPVTIMHWLLSARKGTHRCTQWPSQLSSGEAVTRALHPLSIPHERGIRYRHPHPYTHAPLHTRCLLAR